MGQPAVGLITAGGAFTVGFGAKQTIDRSQLLPMILACIAIGAATFVGMVAGHTNFTLVAIAAAAGFLYGMLIRCGIRRSVGWASSSSSSCW